MMAVTFSLLQMLNEIGTLMAIPLYGSMAAGLGLAPSQVSWALLATTLCAGPRQLRSWRRPGISSVTAG